MCGLLMFSLKYLSLGSDYLKDSVLNKCIIAFVLHNNPYFHYYSCIIVFNRFYSALYS